MARIISIANRKGGVGKTTITLLLATALAKEKNKKVLVVDCDNQRSAADYQKFEMNANGTEPPYQVEALDARFLYDYLKLYSDKYDIIFIDMPRMTDDSKDSATVQILTYCDSILIPVVAGQFDALSTKDFLDTIRELANWKREKGFDFLYYGFLNRKNARKDNEKAVQFMSRLGLEMMEHPLKDLKIFTLPSTYDSILKTKEGQNRFKGFFSEFLKKYDI